MMEKIRAFVAVKAGEELKKNLSAVMDEMRDPPGIKWVHAENLHITLKFLGNTDGEDLPEIKKALGSVARQCPPFALFARGLEAIPNHRYPRVVFADLKGEVQKLLDLSRAVEEAMEPLGYKKEKREFLPHLTLGRVKSFRTKTLLMNKLREYHNREFGPLFAERFYLMKSELNPAGAIYTELAGFDLTEGGN